MAGYRPAMPSKYSDSISRPVRSRRVLVDIQHRLSREEVYRAFIYHATVLVPETYFGGTPNVETLSRNLHVVIYLHGYEFLNLVPSDTPDTDQSEPGQVVKDYAERCTNRLWNSKRVVERA